MIPTVELKQSGKGIGRSRGRPTGVVETKPRRKLKTPGEPASIRALKAAQSAAIRARRSRESDEDMLEDVESLPPPSSLLTYGPEAQLTRYSMPSQAPKRKLLTDQNKGRLKAGAAAVGSAALAYAGKKAGEALVERYGGDAADLAQSVIGRMGGGRRPPPQTPRRGRPNHYMDLVDDEMAYMDARAMSGLGGIPGVIQRDASIPAEGVFADEAPSAPPLYLDYPDTPGIVVTASPQALRNRANIGVDGQGPRSRPQRSNAANLVPGDYFEFSGRKRRRTNGQDGGGLQSPCEHLREAGRQVFDMVEGGDKKGAQKEIAELAQHLKEIKMYVSTHK